MIEGSEIRAATKKKAPSVQLAFFQGAVFALLLHLRSRTHLAHRML